MPRPLRHGSTWMLVPGNKSRALQPTGLWVHPEHTWLVSSPDRLLGEQGLLEVKRFYRLAKPGPHVLIQVLLQLECTGRRFCDVICTSTHPG